jgi:steroid delta-isomerase-like uncharacterized protein
MSGEDIAWVMTRYNALWQPGGMEHADEVIHPDFIRHGSSGTLRGLAAFTRYVSHYREAFPDLAFAVDDWFATRDRIMVRYSFTGTHVRPFMGVAASGRKVSADGVAIYRVAGRKLVEVWDYLDLFGLTRQMGAPLPAINPELSLQ